MGKKTYKFDWDYHREGSDVVKNSHPKQDSVSAESGSVIGAKVFTCCGDFEGLSVSVTKDKEKITNSGLEFGELHDARFIGGCEGETCLQEWELPSLDKGTYNLLFHTGGEELDEYYLTKIKVESQKIADSISIDVGPENYGFDVDYIIRHGDPFPGTDISKNEGATQETAQAKIGQRIEAFISDSQENGHVDSANMFLTKDKIKVSDHSIKFGKIINFQLNDLCCDVLHGDIPKIKKGTYSLVVHVKNNDELEKFYIDKIKIS